MELTSLMDVMFLVLVFFIYCVSEMAVHRGLKVDLPDAAGEKEPGERIIVSISSDDRLQLNGMELGCDEIVSRVKAIAQSGMEIPVLVCGDRKASLGIGIELLGKLKAAGLAKVSFQVSGEEGRVDGKR
jgi:biopolymer transport protein ExbD